MIIRLEIFLAFVICLVADSDLPAQEVPVRLPNGFAIQKVAGNDLIPDASAMTVDPSGMPIVSGPGYVRRLKDQSGDGKFDSFETLAETEGIAQGIWFDGKELWLTVDGAIKRSVSRKQGQPFSFEDIVPITTNAEHGSHAVRKGADGWWYVICGNSTKILPRYYSHPDSPVKDPRAGFLMRFPADVGTGEEFSAQIVCHGFRNAYDFDFDENGGCFVYDSDGERDISLPWYRPTRVFDMKPGDDAGWVSASWKRPASYHDMPDLLGQFGRGSPTGVAVCRSKKFGTEYFGDVFVGDWTFGRIGVAREGHEVQEFAEPEGNFGFAITDLEFSSDGSLFVTTGGRGTEGALYRIVRTSNSTSEKPRDELLRSLKRQARSLELPESKSADFLNLLAKATECDSGRVAYLVRELQLRMGGCDGDRMFAGHEPQSSLSLSDEELERLPYLLQKLVSRGEATFETARLIGMLRLKHDEIANLLAKISADENDPVKRIHYLNCVAVAGGKLSTESVHLVANGLLNVRREIDQAELPVDRNWVPRMRQLANVLFRDMRIAETMVRESSFGQPSDIWIYDVLPEIFRPIARSKIAARLKDMPENATKPQVRVLSADPQYLNLLRMFSNKADFTDAIVLTVSSRPVPADKAVLLRGLKSINPTVNKASLIGLKKLNLANVSAADIQSVLLLESRIGWTNPEISVRDQAVGLLQQWTGKATEYRLRKYNPDPGAIRLQRSRFADWKNQIVADYSIDLPVVASTSQFLDRFQKIDFSSGDLDRGAAAFRKFQCASCHNGRGQNSGPSLVGLVSRFSREDVFRAIIDPNDNVPDRYRATLVATEDGQLLKGSVVYESMAGIMLSTGAGEIVRIDASDIESQRKTDKSLMPEGLLSEASDAEVADLWAYLEKL